MKRWRILKSNPFPVTNEHAWSNDFDAPMRWNSISMKKFLSRMLYKRVRLENFAPPPLKKHVYGIFFHEDMKVPGFKNC